MYIENKLRAGKKRAVIVVKEKDEKNLEAETKTCVKLTISKDNLYHVVKPRKEEFNHKPENQPDRKNHNRSTGSYDSNFMNNKQNKAPGYPVRKDKRVPVPAKIKKAVIKRDDNRCLACKGSMRLHAGGFISVHR